MKRLAIITATSFAPIVALAHPGHGQGSGYEVLHYLTAVEHILPLVIVAAGVLLIRRRFAYARRTSNS